MPQGPTSDKVARDVLRRELRAIEVKIDELHSRRDRLIGAIARLDAIGERPGPRPRELRVDPTTGFRKSPNRALDLVESIPDDPTVVTREDAIDRVLVDHMRSRPVSDALKSRLIRLGLSRFMDPGELGQIQSEISRKNRKRGWVKVGAGRATRWRKATVQDFDAEAFAPTATFLDLDSGAVLPFAEVEARLAAPPAPVEDSSAGFAPHAPLELGPEIPITEPPTAPVEVAPPGRQTPPPLPPSLPSEPGFSRAEHIPALEPHRKTAPRPDPVIRKIDAPPPEDLSEFFPRDGV